MNKGIQMNTKKKVSVEEKTGLGEAEVSLRQPIFLQRIEWQRNISVCAMTSEDLPTQNVRE